MTTAQIAASYDRIACFWCGPDFDQNNGIAAHQRALTFLAGRGAALDMGCGSSGRIMDLLLEAGLQVEGLDISGEMLRLARQRHPQLVFHHADICEWTAPHLYDFISAWDSLWHVPLPQQHAVLMKLLSALTPGGVLIFSAGGLEKADEKQNSAMGVPMYHATLGTPRILALTQEAGCTLRHLEFDQWPEPHLCVIVQRPA